MLVCNGVRRLIFLVTSHHILSRHFVQEAKRAGRAIMDQLKITNTSNEQVRAFVQLIRQAEKMIDQGAKLSQVLIFIVRNTGKGSARKQ